MKIKITILGCGPSSGVPRLSNNRGGDWGKCNPTNLRNKRSRSSILVSTNKTNFLIDTSQDLRHQLLKNGISNIDAVLYTHAHFDHIGGIDELRSLYFSNNKQPVPIYGNSHTINYLKDNRSHLFNSQTIKGKEIYPKVVDPKILDMGDNNILGTNIKVFEQLHTPDMVSLGYRFGDFAYSTDFIDFSKESLDKLKNLKLWIVDCQSETPSPTHSDLKMTLSWVKKMKPERVILTHMNCSLDYDRLISITPDFVQPAYDGMTINL